jgi:phage shock protein PspC (stress-responsive transcriptional regulator)
VEAEPKLMRSRDAALVGGVCAGLASRLDIDPVLVRIATVIVTLATGGLGAIAYGLLWLLLPVDPRRRPRGEKPLEQSRQPVMVGAGFGVITLGLLFIFREAGLWWSDALVWPAALAGAGAGLLWRQYSGTGDPDPAEEESGRRAWAASGKRAPDGTERRGLWRGIGAYRGAFGFALVIGAAVLFLYVQGAFSAAGEAALAAVTLIVALGLILAPLWVRLARNLGRERAERIRSQERAEVAAHLHDSVLQTLAMMQKKSDDPRQVSTLARRQERELREWLSGKTESEREMSLASALEAAAAEVEEGHGVPIDAVTVGDRELDERTGALVAASREALANAARHAGNGGRIRLYAEITPEQTQVFVRDRGAGFDLDSVPEDRRGVRDSILGRMERNGGAAEVRSAEGEGTEVELTMETK